MDRRRSKPGTVTLDTNVKIVTICLIYFTIALYSRDIAHCSPCNGNENIKLCNLMWFVSGSIAIKVILA